MEMPQTQYAKTHDGIHIAYQTLGEGPVDLVYLAPWISHLEINWQEPRNARFLRRLASFSRLLLFDRRGNGMSDPVPIDAPPGLELRMDDALAVMDAVGAERAVLYGASESGALAGLFAASYPDRTVALVIHGSTPRYAWAPDWPWGETQEAHDREMAAIDAGWGSDDYMRDQFPDIADDPALARWLAELLRRSMSPGAALAYERMIWEIDVRDILTSIHVPTLIIHRELDEPEANRYLAEQIPGARYARLPGSEHWDILGDQDVLLDEIEAFVRSVQDEESTLNRVLATILFTDIVGSTEMAARLGDRRWRDVLERHNAAIRGLLGRYRGAEVDTAGDGFFATFDGPARAAKCAGAIVNAVKPLGIEVRAGVHTGEVETIEGKTGGLAVVIGARVASIAGPGEVLVSSTVKDLVAGSGLVFDDRGVHQLKGVPDPWHLYAMAGDAT